MGFLGFVALACPVGGDSPSPPADDGAPLDTGAEVAQADTAEPADVAPDTPLPVGDAPQQDTPPLADVVADSGNPADGSTGWDGVGPLPAGLTGQAPPVSQPLPSFAAVLDTTETLVLPDVLVGHWSVLWFYPMATTAG